MNHIENLFHAYLNPNISDKQCQEMFSFIANSKISFDDYLFLYKIVRLYEVQSQLDLIKATIKEKKKTKRAYDFYQALHLEFSSTYIAEILFQLSKHSQKKRDEVLDQMFDLFDYRSISLIFDLIHENQDIPIERSTYQGNLAQDLSTIEFLDQNATNESKTYLLIANELKKMFDSTTIYDYSLISLQYYKVIEIEIKDKIIKYAFENSGLDMLKFKRDKNDKKPFKYLKLSNISEKLNDVFTLEVINHVLVQTSNYVNKRGVDCFENRPFYDQIFKILGSNEDSLNYLIKITNKEHRDKYRNPPAHTKPLTKKTTTECKEILNCFVNLLPNRLFSGESVANTINNYFKQ